MTTVPVKTLKETVAIFVGEKAPQDVVLVEIVKSWTLWSDGSLVEHGYHYIPHDFFGKLSYEIKTIGSIQFDAASDDAPGFIKTWLLPDATWRRIK